MSSIDRPHRSQNEIRLLIYYTDRQRGRKPDISYVYSSIGRVGTRRVPIRPRAPHHECKRGSDHAHAMLGEHTGNTRALLSCPGAHQCCCPGLKRRNYQLATYRVPAAVCCTLLLVILSPRLEKLVDSRSACTSAVQIAARTPSQRAYRTLLSAHQTPHLGRENGHVDPLDAPSAPRVYLSPSERMLCQISRFLPSARLSVGT